MGDRDAMVVELAELKKVAWTRWAGYYSIAFAFIVFSLWSALDGGETGLVLLWFPGAFLAIGVWFTIAGERALRRARVLEARLK